MNDSACFIDLLNRASKPLADFLWKCLPKIDNDWWENLVIYHLTDIAKQNINAETDSLYDLDTASLLRILDKNWHEINIIENLEYTLRNYIKETQSIRNKWAHQNSEGIPDYLLERHLSTLYLLCKGISADESFLKEIEDARTDILNRKFGTVQYEESENTNKITTESEDLPSEDENHLKIGSVIRVKADKSQRGVIINISQSGNEPRYDIFLDGKNKQYYKSQIEPDVKSEGNRSVTIDEFNAYLTATQISNPNSQILYSLNSAKIDIIPHQFRPVLKFIKSDRPRLLIADGVGVGKTIEAGLILKELEARNHARSVLIICPKPLISERKWEDEMRVRFGEKFKPLNGSELRQAIDDASLDEWDMANYGKIIIPYSLFTENILEENKSYRGLLKLEYPPKFDLVIVDEAHHIRHSDTYAYRGVKYFVDNCDAAVFLTATPIQMGVDDLFTLLNLLRPDLVSDFEIFNSMSEPNQYINKAIEEIRNHKENWMANAKSFLKLAEKTSWGNAVYPANPVYVNVMEILEKPFLNDEERVKLLTDTESLHTFSYIMNRTRRRDIGEYAVRKTNTIQTPFTSKQKLIYDEILGIQGEILSKINPETPIGFMISTLQRRAASCLPGIVPFLDGILKSHLDEYEYIESGYLDDYDSHKIELGSSIKKRIENVIKSAKNLPDDDLKYNKMLDVIKEKQKHSSNNKVMIFSTFRYTLKYLADRMFDDGLRVGIIHGGVKDEDRRYLRDRFKLPKEDIDALDILLFSEVGCEGLDYQFCDCMINYDLPWNPMKIEQRIGRIDRTGQKSESVSIFNLITPETIDADIYDRCLFRIGVFEKSIGGNEEILGNLEKGIKKIVDNFKLNDDEIREKLGQLADNTIRKDAEAEKLAEGQTDLFGFDLPKMQIQKEIEDATSFWLSSMSLENLITVYFRKRFNSEGNFIVGDKSSRKLRINAEYRAILLEDYNNILMNKDMDEYKSKEEYKHWKKWLEGKVMPTSGYYPVYFDSESSSDSSSDLITPIHPLVKQAVSYLLKPDVLVSTKFYVDDSEVEAGEYPFAVYLWDYQGVYKNEMMKPVSENEYISGKVFDYLKTGISDSEHFVIDNDVIEKLDVVHHSIWEAELKKHKLNNLEYIKHRKESLRCSFSANEKNILDQIDSATDEHIRRMRYDQLKKVRSQFQKDMKKLDDSEAEADLSFKPVGYGVVVVR